jgi:hypothetical protein
MLRWCCSCFLRIVFFDCMLLYVPLKNFSLTIAGSREGSLSCHTCFDTGPRFFRSHPKDSPIQSPLYDTRGDVKNLLWPGFSRFPIQSLLTTHKGVRRNYSNQDPHGVPRSSDINTVWSFLSKNDQKLDILFTLLFLSWYVYILLKNFILFYSEKKYSLFPSNRQWPTSAYSVRMNIFYDDHQNYIFGKYCSISYLKCISTVVFHDIWTLEHKYSYKFVEKSL